MKKIILIGTVLLAGIGCFVLVSNAVAKSDGNEEQFTDVVLNETITNEMSETEELKGMDAKFRKYLDEWQIKGASLAITRGDSLLYAKGYGWADKEEGKEMQPYNLLRLASVSKLITACGIMKLQEEGLLDIHDKVFGHDGILNSDFYTNAIRDTLNFNKITVEHLLRHQGGFYRDPLFSSLDVMHQMMLSHPPCFEDFATLVLRNKLRFEPGTSQRYSNFGYLLLSKVIETVSGESYEGYITGHVLEPAGCHDMHIAGNYYADRRPNEVRYYTHLGDGRYIEEYNGSGRTVERCYGGNDIPALSGAGAWCSSTIELARLVASIDYDGLIPDILMKESIDQMTGYIDENTYSLGWNDTNPEKGWSRTGTYSGTSALVKRFPDGECWIFVTNTSTWKGPGQAKYTSDLFDQCRALYSKKLPRRNMFLKAVDQEDLYFNY